jgi:hypothetical protein
MPAVADQEDQTFEDGEFTAAGYSIFLLRDEVNAAGLSVGLADGFYTPVVGGVILHFSSPISAGDVAPLNAVIAAHTGVDPEQDLEQRVEALESTGSTGPSSFLNLPNNAWTTVATASLEEGTSRGYEMSFCLTSNDPTDLRVQTGVLHFACRRPPGGSAEGSDTARVSAGNFSNFNMRLEDVDSSTVAVQIRQRSGSFNAAVFTFVLTERGGQG